MAVNLIVGTVVNASVYCVAKQKCQVAVNRMVGKVVSVAGGATTLDDMAVQLDNNLAPAYKGLMPPVFATYAGATCWAGVTGSRSLTSWSKASAGGGTLAGSLLPTQACALLNWQADGAGPRFRGRMYLPFVSSAALDVGGGISSPAGVSAINTIAITWGIGFVVNNAAGSGSVVINWGILHSGILWLPFIYGSFENAWATQRRRGDFGQLNRLPSFLR